MPTEGELLALCLRWIENPQGDAFDRAMLIDAVKAKIAPHPWVGLSNKEMIELSEMKLGSWDLILEVEEKLREKNA